jgi:hypothetical protein
MAQKHKSSAGEPQLQPLAVTVLLTCVVVAALLLGTVSTGASPSVVGGYEISDAQ